MKLSKVTNSLSTSFNKVGLKVKKHSPEILVITGVIGTVASAVMACKATTKIDTILDNTRENIEKIHDCIENKTLSEEYTPEDGKKDLAIVYAQTGVQLVKLYAPSVILGVLSITSILASNNILRKRNAALGAAYAVVDKGFKEYRNRVVERFGEEVDKELKYNIKAQEIEKEVTDENGKKKKVKETVKVADISGYAKFFDETNPNWKKDAEHNFFFIKAQQDYANDRLVRNGHLFLNDIYESLGFPKTKAGQVVGWVYNPDNPNGDNYIDFGIFDSYQDIKRDFVNGYERSILLDFNVDGNIYESKQLQLSDI